MQHTASSDGGGSAPFPGNWCKRRFAAKFRRLWSQSHRLLKLEAENRRLKLQASPQSSQASGLRGLLEGDRAPQQLQAGLLGGDRASQQLLPGLLGGDRALQQLQPGLLEGDRASQQLQQELHSGDRAPQQLQYGLLGGVGLSSPYSEVCFNMIRFHSQCLQGFQVVTGLSSLLWNCLKVHRSGFAVAFRTPSR